MNRMVLAGKGASWKRRKLCRASVFMRPPEQLFRDELAGENGGREAVCVVALAGIEECLIACGRDSVPLEFGDESEAVSDRHRRVFGAVMELEARQTPREI